MLRYSARVSLVSCALMRGAMQSRILITSFGATSSFLGTARVPQALPTNWCPDFHLHFLNILNKERPLYNQEHSGRHAGWLQHGEAHKSPLNPEQHALAHPNPTHCQGLLPPSIPKYSSTTVHLHH